MSEATATPPTASGRGAEPAGAQARTTGYKALMVHAGLGAAAEARVRLAAGLAGRFGAHLIGLAASPARPLVTGPFGEAGVVAEIIGDAERRVGAELDAVGERFRAAAGGEGGRAEWRTSFDPPADALGREARAADLLVIGRGGDESAGDARLSAEPGDVLMRTGRPVLVVPPGLDALEARRVVVAWKDRREAQRAVADALPFLVHAEEALVVEVLEGADGHEEARRRVDDVAALLARHGVAASGEAVGLHERTVVDELLRAAVRHHADLIVAGGYGHPRLLEWVFGGVTQDLLSRCPACCLLSR